MKETSDVDTTADRLVRHRQAQLEVGSPHFVVVGTDDVFGNEQWRTGDLAMEAIEHEPEAFGPDPVSER